jgi:transcriptional regulator GlxA family with amidase domain
MLCALGEAEDDAPALARTMLARMLIYWALGHLAPERLQTHYADERVEAAVEHLREHLHEKITNARLARLAHMSPNAFIRRFRAVTGSPPQAFLTRLRIERACVLLHDPTQPIAEVAEQTGFCDRYHFSHVFKEHVGTGPAAFRAGVLTGS